MSERHSFTVYRDRWLRGAGSTSRLLRSNGKQCCVGFYLSSLNFTDDALIDNLCTPRGTLPDSALWLGVGRGCLDDGVSDVFDINDDGSIDDEERESVLTQRFAEHNVDVTFLDSEATA